MLSNYERLARASLLYLLNLDNVRLGTFYESQHLVAFLLRNFERVERSVQVTNESRPVAAAIFIPLSDRAISRPVYYRGPLALAQRKSTRSCFSRRIPSTPRFC
jgi:hypothetical protein